MKITIHNEDYRNNIIKSDFNLRTILSMILSVRSELNCAANLIEKEREIKRRKDRSKKGNENERKTKKER
jgi:hypothetical protein